MNKHPLQSTKKFELVTIGRAIRYLDAAMLNTNLKRVLEEGGHVVICGAEISAEETAWAKPVAALAQRFQKGASKYSRDIDGQQKMSAISFQPQVRVLQHEHTTYDFNKIVDHVLSYRTISTNSSLNLADFMTALRTVLAPHMDQTGNFPTCVRAWAKVYKLN